MVDTDRSVIEVAFSATRRPLFERGLGAEPDPAEEPGPEAEASPEPQRHLDGRLVVVTGATGLLGAAMVAELAARGARVCLIGRDLDALRDAVDRLEPDAHTAMLRCDLASADDIVDATDFVERIGSPVDLLVHAAGLNAPTSLAGSSVEDLDEHYLLDVRGPYLLTQRLLPLLREASGSVVFFSSGAGSSGAAPPTDVHRTISQAGRGALAEALRDEVQPFGVGVLSVHTDDVLDAGESGADTAAFLRRCASTVLDALVVDALDVTELHLRQGDRRVDSEQR